MIGMLRVKNEARWLVKVINSIMPVCQHIVVFDDHSTDGTLEMLQGYWPTLTVIPSPFEGLDEARDKTMLVQQVLSYNPDWILHIDGDEVLDYRDWDFIRKMTERAMPGEDVFNLQVLYLWNNESTVRMDGIYKNFNRPSLFRAISKDLSFRATGHGGNFHCSNLPQQLKNHIPTDPLLSSPIGRLLHYGYIDAELRRRKYEFYNAKDPNNTGEDCYRHVVLGDPGFTPAWQKTVHAGPLQLKDINTL